jgi:hypothetical protein
MTSVVGICNLALSHIAAKSTIESLNEDSEEARFCSLHYAPSRDAVLRDHDWAFARKTVELAVPSGESAPVRWKYIYTYPSDCLAARRVLTGTSDTHAWPYVYDHDDWDYSPMIGEAIPFEVGLAADSSGMRIYTGISPATLAYTAKVNNTELFDPLFVEAFSWRLALAVTPSLQVDGDFMKVAAEMYQMSLSRAMTASANERTDAPKGAAPYERARW